MKRLTASDEIAEGLRGDILSLRLVPGAEINCIQIAEKLGISKSPVRDALLKLRDENLVQIVPQSGTHVAKIDLSQVEVERFLRTSLESGAALKFCTSWTELDLLEMEHAIKSQEALLDGGDMVSFLEYDDAFHRTIFQGVHLDRLWQIIQRESGNYHRIRLLSFTDPEMLGKIIPLHQELLDAFRSRDAAKVAKLEASHLGKLEAERSTLVARYPSYFR